jgi:hypothetical protein
MNNPFLLALKRILRCQPRAEAIDIWRMFEQRFLSQSCEQKSMRQKQNVSFRTYRRQGQTLTESANQGQRKSK